jgi:signal transduction histidine kinase
VDFTKLLAHEVKAPLLAIELRLRSIAMVEPKLADCLEELERVQLLVDRVLAWSHAQSLRSEDFDLAGPVEKLERRFRPLAEATGSVLVVDHRGARAKGDADATEIVLANLLDNAVRHAGPARRIQLSVFVEAETVTVQIEDDGAGIPEAARERIFEPFNRPQREGRGSGLGLFIARQLAQAQGGSLRLSGPARFVLILPKSK